MSSREITKSGICPVCGKRAIRKVQVDAARITSTSAGSQAALDEAAAAAMAKPTYHKRCDPAEIERAARREKWDRESVIKPLQDQAGIRMQEAADHNSQHEYQFWSRFRSYLADFIDTGDIG